MNRDRRHECGAPASQSISSGVNDSAQSRAGCSSKVFSLGSHTDMPVKKTTKKTELPETTSPAVSESPKQPAKKRAPAKSAAATHKSAAPRAARPRAAKPPVAKPAFDVSLHHDEIAREAYHLWEARGYSNGNEAEDWFRAVEIVRARYE